MNISGLCIALMVSVLVISVHGKPTKIGNKSWQDFKKCLEAQDETAATYTRALWKCWQEGQDTSAPTDTPTDTPTAAPTDAPTTTTTDAPVTDATATNAPTTTAMW